MFLRIFFGDTDSVSLFSQFPYNNATFEQYFPKFSRKLLEKNLFCGVHHNLQQNHLKQKNQKAFVKGDVSRGNPGRIFFFDFSIFCSTWKPKNRFSLKKKSGKFIIVQLMIIKQNKKAPRNTWWIMWKTTVQNFKTIGPVDFELWSTQTSEITSFRKTLQSFARLKIQNKTR